MLVYVYCLLFTDLAEIMLQSLFPPLCGASDTPAPIFFSFSLLFWLHRSDSQNGISSKVLLQTHYPKIQLFGVLIILNWRHLRNSKCRERLFLPNDRSSQRNSVVINLSPSFNNQVGLPHIIGEETGSPHHTQTNLVTNCHTSIIIKVHSYFLKVILPKRPMSSPVLFSIYKALNPKF